MDNLQMAKQGTSYTQEGLSLAWGFGEGAIREVVAFPPELRVGRINAKIASGYIVETSDPITPTGPPPNPDDLVVRLSAPANQGDGLVFNSTTGLFDPAPPAANISLIELPEDATIADIAMAFNDLREVLIEASVMAADPT